MEMNRVPLLTFSHNQVGKLTDPTTEKRAEKVVAATRAVTTFEGVAREWMDRRKARWSQSYTVKVSDILRSDLFPRIGAVPVTEITAPLLLTGLRPIEARGALEVAARARRWADLPSGN